MNTLRTYAKRIALSAMLPLMLASAAVAASGTTFTLLGAKPATLTRAELTAAQKTATPGHISADKKTLAFSGKTVRLVENTWPDNDMLSYRIDGLRNPTLVVPRGATIKILFVNTDEDMLHNIRFGAWQGTWPSVFTAAFVKKSVGAPPLPHISKTVLPGEQMTLRIPAKPGTYAYFCTVRGHAPGGMWGKIIVR